MYSYEDRLRAVQLYIKLGKRAGLTIRQLGYPSKNALKVWHLAYEQSSDLPRAYMREPKYTPTQQKVAVDHFLSNGRCVAVTIKALGYPSKSLLGSWIQQAHPELCPRIGQAYTPLSSQAKQSAVMALCLRQGSAESVAKDLGVSRPSLYVWKNQLLNNAALSSMKLHQNPSPDSQREELLSELERLQRDVKRLKLEQDILKKANELLKKELGIDQQLLTNREKTQLVDALRSTHVLSELLAKLELPRSSYFYHRGRLGLGDKYATVRAIMVDIFEQNYRCYGSRRMHATLARLSLNISEKVVRRLMKQESLVPVSRKRRRYGSYMGEISPAPDNLLNRDFSACAPNRKWLTDITEFQIPAGKVYLSPMIDCFDGMVVSWSIGTRPDAELVNTMLDAAIETVVTSTDRPVVHSDRGGHYRWPGWLTRMGDAHLTRSMSRKACSPDNAACEGFFGRLKNELFYARNWMNTTIDEFTTELNTYIRWYNESRIKISLGSLSPMEHRKSLGITI
jgi:transposase InsO family protein/transposase-like protein